MSAITKDSFEIRRSTRPGINFDGSNDSIQLGNDATLWSKSLTKFSFCFWIYPRAAGDGNLRDICNHGQGTAQGFSCYINSTASPLRTTFQIRNAAGTPILAFNDTLVTFRWQFVVCTYDNSLGSGNIKIYINGVVGTSATLTEAINLSAIMELGAGTTDFFGDMYGFKFWDTTALSQTDVTNLYNLKEELVVSPAYHLPMDEGTGSPRDVISGSKTGTLTNGAAWTTQNQRGGFIDLTTNGLVNLNAENNYWDAATGSETLGGSNQYKIFYVRFIGTGTVKALSLALNQKPKTGYTNFKWAFDPQIFYDRFYRYRPFKTFNGTSDFVSVPDATSLDLVQFSVACWFRTSADYSTVGGVLVNKGGLGSDTAGQNMAYGLWFDPLFDNVITAGFEEGAGTDHFIQSTFTYNDGKWHFAVITYDQVTLRLYVDGYQVASAATATTPESNAQPLVIGRNSRASDSFFNGDIDEVRIWNNDLTAAEVRDLWRLGTIPQFSAIVYENTFGLDSGNIDSVAQVIHHPSFGVHGTPTWFEENTVIPLPPNIGNFIQNQYIPIIGWWSNIAGSPDIENDFVQLNLYYALPPGQTGGGSNTGDPQTPPAQVAMIMVQGGDWGETGTTKSIVAQINSFGTIDVVIDSGDKAYASSTSQFFSIIGNLKSVMCDARGNHDSIGDYISEFTAGKHYNSTSATSWYYKTIQNVAIISIDTESSFSSGSAQYIAITEFLKAIKNNPNIDWIFVTHHKPEFGAPSTHGYNEGNIVQTFQPLFDQYGVAIVFNAHNHNYERTFPVKYNSSSPTSPTVVDSSDGPYTVGNGTVFLRNGTMGHDSGGNLYSLGSQKPFTKYQNDSENGTTKIVFSNNNKTITVSWITLDGITRDTFVMNKT